MHHDKNHFINLIIHSEYFEKVNKFSISFLKFLMTANNPLSSLKIVDIEQQGDKEIKEPEKPPQSIEEQYTKLNDLIKHMEFNIVQNRKRCDNSSLDCYTLLRSTELLAFD